MYFCSILQNYIHEDSTAIADIADIAPIEVNAELDIEIGDAEAPRVRRK